jgi:hypothetical protein
MNSFQNDGDEYVSSPFTMAFLHPQNLNNILYIMTLQLSDATQNPDVHMVELTQGISDSAQLFAYQYRDTMPTQDVMDRANLVFADQMLSQNETRYHETAFWRRWCEQGIPDPNNIPLPLASERTDFTTQTSNYMLSNPIRVKSYPRC